MPYASLRYRSAQASPSLIPLTYQRHALATRGMPQASVLRLGNISRNFWKFSEILPKISKGLEKLEIFGKKKFYSKAR